MTSRKRNLSDKNSPKERKKRRLMENSNMSTVMNLKEFKYSSDSFNVSNSYISLINIPQSNPTMKYNKLFGNDYIISKLKDMFSLHSCQSNKSLTKELKINNNICFMSSKEMYKFVKNDLPSLETKVYDFELVYSAKEFGKVKCF